jgi:RNA polymerase sigma factor (sigma-70 family)
MDDPDFAGLLARARAGDAAAAETLLRAFEPEVRTMVRVRLPRALRAQFDSMDFVQAVWTSVVAGEGWAGGEFSSARHFLGFLAGVARNKVLAEYRRRTRTRKYELGREEPLYVRRGGRDQPRAVVAHDATPSEHAQAEDRLLQLVAGRPRVEAAVVALRRQGLSFAEVGARLGVHERSVRRIVEDLWRRLERESP